MSKFDQAIAESDELIQTLREAAASPHVIRCLLRDIWYFRHNVPYVTTLYEANQEMSAPLLQKQAASGS
jgi:hypothetical protein